MKRILTSLLLTLVASGLFAVPPVSSIKLALITDTHVSSPENNEDMRRTVNDINGLDEIDFVIHAGDVTEFGSDAELVMAKDILDGLNIPLYIVPGNHDSNWSESGTNSFLRVFG